MNPAFADYITLMTGIKTDTGMFWENISCEILRGIEQRRRSGFYISSNADFSELLPQDYLRKKKIPKIIEKIGPYYLGSL